MWSLRGPIRPNWLRPNPVSWWWSWVTLLRLSRPGKRAK